jgi:hypothetical protein
MGKHLPPLPVADKAGATRAGRCSLRQKTGRSTYHPAAEGIDWLCAEG